MRTVQRGGSVNYLCRQQWPLDIGRVSIHSNEKQLGGDRSDLPLRDGERRQRIVVVRGVFTIPQIVTEANQLDLFGNSHSESRD